MPFCQRHYILKSKVSELIQGGPHFSKTSVIQTILNCLWEGVRPQMELNGKIC